MSEQGVEDGALSPLQRALIAVRDLKAKVARLEVDRSEPIAVVGLACRFPGAPSPAALWDVLANGRDTTGAVPAERWDAGVWAREGVPERGGFLENVAHFDASFFGIPPREASEMDPIQRLLLEVAWHALEDACIPPEALAGTSTGVFLGLGLSDYGRRHFLGSDPGRLTAWSGTGALLSVAAGRMAYALGLQGPALTLDTACSSSLVATHLAMGALRTGEVDVALAAGANLLLSPMPSLYFHRLGALAPDGRCKSFSASADGYGRSEGVGLLVLKRLRDAVSAGDPIRAVLRGSAVNHDGRSNGLTAPSGRAQRAVIHAALADARLTPEDIGLVEAHGTGTPLGDPIEVDALRSVFGEHPVRLGSVKTNLGHTETAAGIAGLAKAILSLEHNQIPGSLHCDTVSPRISLGRFEIPTSAQPWPDSLPQRVGVSSFGLSGTNAHVIVEGAPDRVPAPVADGPHLFVLSARSERALLDLASRTVDTLNPPLAHAANTAWFGRSHLSWRLAVVGDTVAEIREELRHAVVRGADARKAGWIFSGSGAEWVGMGQALAEDNPLFREVQHRVAEVFSSPLEPQVALYALQCGIAAVLSKEGLAPAALLGQGVGEIAAAQWAGVFSLEDGARMVQARPESASSETDLSAFREVLDQIPMERPRQRLISGLDGALLGDAACSPAYWLEQARQPSNLSEALAAASNCDAFVEIGPHPLVCAEGARVLPRAHFVGTVSQDDPGQRGILRCLGSLWSAGVELERTPTLPTPVALPSMPFLAERHWVDRPVAHAGVPVEAVHRIAWEEEAPPSDPALQPRWWVLARGPSDVELALVEAGCTVHRIVPGGRFAVTSQGVEVFPSDAQSFREVLAHCGRPDHIVVLWSLTESARAREALLGALHSAQLGVAPVSVVVPAKQASGVPGLIRVLRAEHPARAGSVIHVEEGVAAKAVLAEVEARTPEVHLGAVRRVPRLRRASLTEAVPLRGTVWLTGASGDLGTQFARRLAKLADTLVLLSRRGTPEEELLRLGPHVRSVQGDVTDNLVPLAAQAPPDVVIHLAGERVDGAFDSVQTGDIERALRAKVDGAWRLNEVAPDAELILVGSAASWLGNPRQAAYAAANAWLEGFARWRSEQGAPTWCLAPGPVAGTTMSEGLLEQFRSVGAHPLAMADVLELVLAARGHADPVLLLTPFDWERWATRVPGPLLSEVASRPAPPSTKDVPRAVAEAVRQVLGRDTPLPNDQGLFDAGLDSVMAMELRARLESLVGRSLPVGVIFDHPTIAKLSSHLAAPTAPTLPARSASERDDAVAIVGIGCRFPGAGEGPEAFWSFLREGGVGIRPLDRWDLARWQRDTPTPGHHTATHAGLLDDVAAFDAARFGISPREAAALDPQQRLLLEASWSALEDAGRPPREQEGRAVGVFVGIGGSEYRARFDPLDETVSDLHSGTGNDTSFAAGRIAYAFGLRGPALAVDTACSSSLVALHLAAQALRRGECDLALAGGVQVLSDPETTVQLSQLRALAPDGRSKPFDARADGFGRGEGVGVVALVRLADAKARGDQIWGVLRGSAVGHDGASAGLTVPHGIAQQEVLAAALADAAVDPHQVGFLETHGTGTVLGDPIEVDAIRAVYGGLRASPLALGALKANIGHLEAGAGIAGVIKACLALHHGEIPGHPTLQTLNPELTLDGLSIPTTLQATSMRFAAVSGFGMSGTNAHVVLEKSPPVPSVPAQSRPRMLWVGSPRESAGMPSPEEALARGAHRSIVGARQAVVFGGEQPTSVTSPGPIDGAIAWLFTGQGAQWETMGMALEAAEPDFAKAMAGCRRILAEHSIDLDAVRSDARIHDTRFTQPVGFAVGWSLASWLRSRGAQPDWVMGHSLGEWVAAAVAEVVSWEDALRLVIRRGQLMGDLPRGASVAVFCGAAQAASAIEDSPVDVAGKNGAGETVLSGPREALEVVVKRLGVEHRWLAVSHAFHSRMMDPAVGPFAEAVSQVSLHRPVLPLVTNADGKRLGERALDPHHWARLIRMPVAFAEGVSTLREAGVGATVEVGPHPVLSRMVDRVGRQFTTLRRGGDGVSALYTVLGELWTCGARLDWPAITGATQGARLPPSPFDRARHWVDRETSIPEDWLYQVVWEPYAGESTSSLDGVEVFDGSVAQAIPHAQEVIARGGRWAALVDSSIEGAAVAGFARSVALEHPLQFAGVADTESGLRQLGAETQIRNGRVRRLLRGAERGEVSTDGRVLVTGGTGAIGAAVVGLLVKRGHDVLVVSRGGQSIAGAPGLAVDLSDPEAVARVDFGDVRGVVHCAGVGHRVALSEESPASVDGVFGAKVYGARALDARFDQLDFFIGVSSVAATWGGAQQTVYAAANAALEAVVEARRNRGEEARVVALGPVQGGLVDAEDEAWLAKRGLHAMPVEVAAAAVLSVHGVVAHVDWSRWLAVTTARRPQLFAALETSLELPARPRVAEAVADRVMAAVVSVLRAPGPVDAAKGLFDLGLDSVMAVELAGALQAELGVPVHSTVAFEHSSVEALTAYFEGGNRPRVAVQPTSQDSIVLVGMGCRFPGGVDSPESFWDLLCSETHTATPIPPSRWDAAALYASEPGTPGRSYVTEASFIDGVEDFDPQFFGMAPLEAASLDPAQRLLLEVSWQALERAGLAEGGGRVGVFCGIPESSYLDRFRTPEGPRYMDAYAGTGNESSFAAGRVAYCLGVTGPAISLNTACSSSLVALHLAVEALRNGECDAALAGGVSLMLSAENQVYLSRLGALSPDGRCKTFDAAADGYGRGEGAGMVALMRRGDAEASGRPILAEVLSTAVNHDGASGGLTVPNGTAQEAVVRDALARAGLGPEDVGFIEAHGTGTRLGDPIEIHALRRAFDGRSAPLPVASVKTVFGHLEQASGVASLIKVVLQQQHGEILPQLHFDTLNPEIDPGFITIPKVRQPWTGSRTAGISGFGLSGTNAHVILGAGAPRAPSPGLPLLLGSATQESAVHELWQRLDPILEEQPATHLGGTLARRRAHAVRQWRLGERRGPVLRANRSARVGLLFTGQGSQYPHMGMALADTEPVFREALHEVAALATPLLGRDLLAALQTEAVHETAITQPALFAFEWAMAKLLASLGIEATVAAGHSVGELVAAAWAGMLSLPDAVAFVVGRGRLMGELEPGGAMAAVFAAEPAVRAALVQGAEIAGVNHETEVVISGEVKAVEQVLATLSSVPHHRLTVSHAFHSARMEPLLDALVDLAAGLDWHPPRIPVVRGLDGKLHENTPPEYWAKQARQAIRFADGVAEVSDRASMWVEVGPHPVLAGSVLRVLPDAPVVGCGHRSRPGFEPVLEALGTLWSHGVEVDWKDRYSPETAVLPPTPFVRERCWQDALEVPTTRVPTYAIRWPAVPAKGEGAHRVIEVPAIADASALADGLSALLKTLQQCAQDREPTAFVTRRRSPWTAAVHAAIRSAAAEGLNWSAVEAQEESEAEIRAAVADGERWVALRDGVRHVARLEAVTGTQPVRIRSDSAYLITGGFGDLGVACAAALIEAGAAEVWLVSRTPREAVLESLGPKAKGLACDVGDAEAVSTALRSITLPLAGVIHGAGVLRDGPLASLTPAHLSEVLHAKVGGALALRSACEGQPLDFFVMMGSASAVMGSAGQVPYAAANATLAGLASSWRAEGFPASCLSWGPWQVGMAGRLSAAIRAQQAAMGIRPLSAERGVASLLQLLGGPRSETVILDMDWSRFAPAPGDRFTASLQPATVLETGSGKEERSPAPTSAAELESMVEDQVRTTLRLSPNASVDRSQSLIGLGLDSLMAVTLRNGLADRGFDLPIARLIGGPSVEEIASMAFAARQPEPAAMAEASEAEGWLFHPATSHVLVALAALTLGAILTWTVLRILPPDVPVSTVETSKARRR